MFIVLGVTLVSGVASAVMPVIVVLQSRKMSPNKTFLFGFLRKLRGCCTVLRFIWIERESKRRRVVACQIYRGTQLLDIYV